MPTKLRWAIIEPPSWRGAGTEWHVAETFATKKAAEKNCMGAAGEHVIRARVEIGDILRRDQDRWERVQLLAANTVIPARAIPLDPVDELLLNRVPHKTFVDHLLDDDL